MVMLASLASSKMDSSTEMSARLFSHSSETSRMLSRTMFACSGV